MTAADLAQRLEARAAGDSWHAKCPAHEDKKASLSIGEGKDGHVLLHCHAGCDTSNVVEAMGLTTRDLFPENAHTHVAKPTEYDYRDENRNLLYQVVRYPPKDFRQRIPRADGAGWTWKTSGVRRVLYRLPELLASPVTEPVFIVEGEKDAENLRELGLIATTNAGGAGKWRQVDDLARKVLAGRLVIVLPDNDETGRKHGLDIERSLDGVATVRVLQLPGLPSKGDVSDWISSGGTREKLLELVAKASLAEPAAVPSEAKQDHEGRELVSGNYDSLATILQENIGNVLENRLLRFDELGGVVMLGNERLRDNGVRKIRRLIEGRQQPNGRKLRFREADLYSAVDLVADGNKFHPVRTYLEGLIWDSEDRLPQFIEHIKAEDIPLVRAMLSKTMIAAVARAMEPGCQVDTVLVLVGEQGIQKSSLLAALAGKWFSDSPLEIGHKDGMQALRGKWFVELSELESLRRAKEVTTIKSFITSRVDNYRPSYGKLEVEVKRSCVLVGSTNEPEFLTDPTGNRRFWPVRLSGRIDLGWVKTNRDQLWGQAVAAWARGEQWHLTDEEEELLRREHVAHKVSDPWMDAVLDYSENRVRVYTKDVLEVALGKKAGEWNQNDQKRVAALLKAAGYEKKIDGKGRSVFIKTDPPQSLTRAFTDPISPTVTDPTDPKMDKKTNGSNETPTLPTTPSYIGEPQKQGLLGLLGLAATEKISGTGSVEALLPSVEPSVRRVRSWKVSPPLMRSRLARAAMARLLRNIPVPDPTPVETPKKAPAEPERDHSAWDDTLFDPDCDDAWSDSPL